MTQSAVLIADDDEGQRREIAECLDRLGVDHAQAGDAGEARQLFQEVRPRIVLLDRNLPAIDGLEAFHWMREQDPRVKIMLMSAYMNPLGEAEDGGLDAFAVVEKPLPLATLGRFIQNVLSAHAPA